MTGDLSNDGFATVPDALPSVQVDALVAALAALDAGYGLRNLLRDCPAVARVAETLKSIVKPVLGEGAFAARGLFFDKLPGANWEVGWHQDLSIAVVERIETPGFTGWSVKQGGPACPAAGARAGEDADAAVAPRRLRRGKRTVARSARLPSERPFERRTNRALEAHG